MIAPSHDNQFAPAVPSPQLSIGRPASSSLGRAATLSTFDHQKTTHRGHGACRNRDGASRRDALFPADRQGRVHSFAAGSVMAFSSTMTLFHPVTGRPFGVGIFPALSQIDGIGRRANAILANLIHNRRQRGFQAFAERLPHFRKSFRGWVAVEATKPREASEYAPHLIGEVRNV